MRDALKFVCYRFDQYKLNSTLSLNSLNNRTKINFTSLRSFLHVGLHVVNWKISRCPQQCGRSKLGNLSDSWRDFVRCDVACSSLGLITSHKTMSSSTNSKSLEVNKVKLSSYTGVKSFSVVTAGIKIHFESRNHKHGLFVMFLILNIYYSIGQAE